MSSLISVYYSVAICELTSGKLAKRSETTRRLHSKLNVYFLIFPPGFVASVHPITR